MDGVAEIIKEATANIKPGGVTYVSKDELNRPSLLVTREATHGSFQDNAIISQAIKSFFRASKGWGSLTDVEREAMDMIALKFSRILSGKSMTRVHWEDVRGYAALVEEQCP